MHLSSNLKVRHGCTSTQRGLALRVNNAIFNLFYGNSLVYNTCWEDPAIDQQVLGLQPDHRLVVITSAGCNVLDYCLACPGQIHAVDANPRQNALLELKLAGIRHLEHREFFALFGRGRHPCFRHWYQQRLRPDLSPSAQAFWDQRQHWFDRNFYYHGLSGLVARTFGWYLHSRPRLRQGVFQMLASADLAGQAELYRQQVEPHLWGRSMRWILDRQVTMSLLGVPRAQVEELRRHPPYSVANFVQAALHQVFTTVPLQNNYFWKVYLLGHYPVDCCPRYLQPQHFQALKSGLVDRIRLHTTTVSGFLAGCQEPLDRFVLLDHMDWMSHHQPEALNEEWRLIIARSRPGARILFRSAAPVPDYLDRIQFPCGDRVRRLREVVSFDDATASRLHPTDRVGTYAGFHIADRLPLPGASQCYEYGRN